MGKYLFLFPVIIVFLFSCAGSPGDDKERGRRVPEWTFQSPEDIDYYIGIGSSHSGNEEKDIEQADAGALEIIVKKISIDLFQEKEKRFQYIEILSFEKEVREVLKKNPDVAKSFASYYSFKSGYWSYLRLLKDDWEKIKRTEINILTNKSIEKVRPAIDDLSRSIASRMSTIIRSRNDLINSPYLFDSEISFAGKTGNIIDLFEETIIGLLNSLIVYINPGVFYVEPGKEAKIVVQIKTKTGGPIGSLPVAISLQDKARPVAQFVTIQNGTYNGLIKFEDVSVGKINGRVEINLSAMGFYSKKSRNISPFRNFIVHVYPVSSSLEVIDKSGIGYPGLYNSVTRLFSGDFPFRLAGKGQKYLISFILVSENIEEDIYTEGLYLTKTRAIISLKKGHNEIYKYESNYFKDGGNNWIDSKMRSIKKLFNFLNNDKEYIDKISKYIQGGQLKK